MATKSISELTSAVAVDNGTLLEVATPDAGSASGYTSEKVSVAQLADHTANTVIYPTLQTTAKTLVGAINEAAQGGGGGGSSTLAGLTDVDISNPTNGQTLVYNATSGKWENGSGGGGGSTPQIYTLSQIVDSWGTGFGQAPYEHLRQFREDMPALVVIGNYVHLRLAFYRISGTSSAHAVIMTLTEAATNIIKTTNLLSASNNGSLFATQSLKAASTSDQWSAYQWSYSSQRLWASLSNNKLQIQEESATYSTGTVVVIDIPLRIVSA